MSLFQSSSGELPYVVAQDEMIIVSDLVHAILAHRGSLVTQLEVQRDDRLAGSALSEADDRGVRADIAAESSPNHIPASEDVRSIAEGVATLAVFAFLERTFVTSARTIGAMMK